MSSTLQSVEAGVSDFHRTWTFNKDNSDHGWGVLPYADIPMLIHLFSSQMGIWYQFWQQGNWELAKILTTIVIWVYGRYLPLRSHSPADRTDSNSPYQPTPSFSLLWINLISRTELSTEMKCVFQQKQEHTASHDFSTPGQTFGLLK